MKHIRRSARSHMTSLMADDQSTVTVPSPYGSPSPKRRGFTRKSDKW